MSESLRNGGAIPKARFVMTGTREEPRFSQIWDGKELGIDLPRVWDQVRIVSRNPGKILEVGSFEGFSACKMIELFSPYNPIDLTCVDTWEGVIRHDERVGGDHEVSFHRNLEIARRDTPHPVTLRTLKMDSFLALSSLICQGKSRHSIGFTSMGLTRRRTC